MISGRIDATILNKPSITEGFYYWGFLILQFQILIIGHSFVDNPFRGDFDNPVSNGLHEFVVMRGEDYSAGEVNQAIVELGD